jgi:hypothetical protein
MALEDVIAANTKAIEALTAALKASGGGKASGGTAAAPAGKYTKEQVQGALQALKEKKGADACKKIVKEVGGADMTKDITDPVKLDAVYLAAVAKAEEEEM